MLYASVCTSLKSFKMAYINKEYKYQKEENFEGFLKAAGLSPEGIQKYLAYKPTSKLVKNGDTYTYITTTEDGARETSFTPGVEVDDQVKSLKFKSTFTIDGNTVTQLVKTDKGDAVFKKDYNGDELVVTITSPKWDGTAKRYYKA